MSSHARLKSCIPCLLGNVLEIYGKDGDLRHFCVHVIALVHLYFDRIERHCCTSNSVHENDADSSLAARVRWTRGWRSIIQLSAAAAAAARTLDVVSTVPRLCQSAETTSISNNFRGWLHGRIILVRMRSSTPCTWPQRFDNYVTLLSGKKRTVNYSLPAIRVTGNNSHQRESVINKYKTTLESSADEFVKVHFNCNWKFAIFCIVVDKFQKLITQSKSRLILRFFYWCMAIGRSCNFTRFDWQMAMLSHDAWCLKLFQDRLINNCLISCFVSTRTSCSWLMDRFARQNANS